MSVLSMIGAPALAVTLAIGPVAASASADGTPAPGTPAPGAGTSRLVQACDRIPGRITKVERLGERLHADARTRGSIAFLEARITRARSEGHDDLVRLLTDRLAVRRDLDATLPDVLARLRDAQRVCSARTGPAASGPAASAPATSGPAAS